MVEPNGMLNDLGRKSVAFLKRCGSIHLAIVALPPLTCQYPKKGDPSIQGNPSEFMDRISGIRSAYSVKQFTDESIALEWLREE